MKIEIIGHSDRYSVEQISCLFFKNSDEVLIKSIFDEEKNAVITEVETGNEYFKGEFAANTKDIKAFKNSVKKSAFLAMKKTSARETPWGVLTGIRPTKFCRDLHQEFSYEEINRILTEDYWVDKDKADFCIDVTKNSEKIINNISMKDAGIYIGVPFCPSRCSYCSFISESAALYSKFIPEYANALKKEIKKTAELIAENNYNITSLYIGGGTPPALGVKLLSEVIDEALKNFGILANNIEFTVEAGRPDIIDDELIYSLKEKGVNRLCINPQTMNDETLKIIGRNHTALQTEIAFEKARKTGFNNINSDLIAGLPGENAEMFENTLERIKNLSPEGLTVHSMYLKRASRLNKDDAFGECADIDKMINTAREFAESNGYKPYYMYKQRSTMGNLENTGYAKSGFESIYNIGIMEEVQNIFAIGSGASSKIIGKNKNIERVYNIKDAFSYIRDIDSVIELKNSKLQRIINNE